MRSMQDKLNPLHNTEGEKTQLDSVIRASFREATPAIVI